jgi:hypothetical protein
MFLAGIMPVRMGFRLVFTGLKEQSGFLLAVNQYLKRDGRIRIQ